MPLHDRPLVFLTDGATASLAALPGLADLVNELQSRLTLLYLTDQPDAGGSARIEDALARVQLDHKPGVIVAAPSTMQTALAQLPRQNPIVALPVPRRNTLSRLLANNSFDQLLRGAGFPILALPERSAFPHIRRVLFPIDFSPRSTPALDDTIAFCKALAAELHLLHVFGDDRLPPTEQNLERRRSARNPLELYRMDTTAVAELSERAQTQNVRAISATAEGRAHTEIVKYAAAQEISLIVMASHGRRTLEDLLRGSTTPRVVAAATVPVLALPSGTSGR